MPDGEPRDWDFVEECEAYELAREFAREWLVDRNAAMAVFRMGFIGEMIEADEVGTTLRRHRLVQDYIIKFMGDFRKEAGLTNDHLLALLHGEAVDRGYGSSGGSRVRAILAMREIFKELEADLKASEAVDGEDGAEDQYSCVVVLNAS
jgi:hypothetical protein